MSKPTMAVLIALILCGIGSAAMLWPGGRTHDVEPPSQLQLFEQECAAVRLQVEPCRRAFDVAFESDIDDAITDRSGLDRGSRHTSWLYPSLVREAVRRRYRDRHSMLELVLGEAAEALANVDEPRVSMIQNTFMASIEGLSLEGGVIEVMVTPNDGLGTRPVEVAVQGEDWSALRSKELALLDKIVRIRGQFEALLKVARTRRSE